MYIVIIFRISNACYKLIHFFVEFRQSIFSRKQSIANDVKRQLFEYIFLFYD